LDKRPFPKTVLQKAQRLIRKDAVSRIADDVYYVKSEHPEKLRTSPFYMVKKKNEGGWSCSCKGYENRGVCSHSLAVLMVESQSYEKEMLQDSF